MVDYQGYNNSPTILISMREIDFPSLKRIYLPKNNVESVEIFCRVRMPVLEEFNLGLNHVVSIDNVRKANWPNFSYLNFSRCWDMKMEISFQKAVGFVSSEAGR